MTYEKWFEEHANKHKKIVNKLIKKGLTKSQIIKYFDFENMVKNEPDFCFLYPENKKCHDMEELNCYLCACPNFRFNDNGFKKVDNNTQFSFCSIESKDGKQALFGDAIHQDCSSCGVPHHKAYVEKNFDIEWKKVMKNCKKT